MLNKGKIFLAIILSCFSVFILFSSTSFAESTDDWKKIYERQKKVEALLSCQKEFRDNVSNDIFLSRGYANHRDGYNIGGDCFSVLSNLLGHEPERSDMIDLGYTWDTSKTKLQKPSDINLRKNILSKFNGGKDIDFSDTRMQWVEADKFISERCTILEKITLNDHERNVNADKIQKAKNQDPQYVIIKEPSGDVLYHFEGNWSPWTEHIDCRKKLESKNVLLLTYNNNEQTRIDKIKRDTKKNEKIAGFAYKLCEKVPKGPGRDNCVSVRADTVRKCYSDNDGKFIDCLKEKFPNDREQIEGWMAEINKDAEKAAEDAANKAGTGLEEGDSEEASCNIEGIGWIICPTMNFIASLNDAMFSLISNFLTIGTKAMEPGDSNNTFKAWGLFRDIANSLFVIVFLFIIFSHITNQGLSNYAVKSILPRIIIGAILINVSFYICQIAVDLSNILGNSLKETLENMSGGANGVFAVQWYDVLGLIISGTVTTIGAIGIAGAALWAIGIPGAIAFFISALMTLMILIGRSAGVILLVVLSPLAISSWILPNTEKWFKRWLTMFVGLLVVFPVVSLLFGMGRFAATILDDPDNGIMRIAALIVTALPLLATPSLLRKSMESLGSIGQIAGSLAQKYSGAASDKYKGSNFAKHREKNTQLTKAKIASGTYEGRNPLNRWRSRANKRLNNNDRFNRITGNYGNKRSMMEAMVMSAENKEQEEQVEAARLKMSSGIDVADLPDHASTMLKSAIQSGDITSARAAQKILLSSGAPGVKLLRSTLSSSESSGISKNDSVMTALRHDINAANLKGKDATLARWAYDTGTIKDINMDAATYSSLNGVEIAGQSAADIRAGIDSGGITESSHGLVMSSDAARTNLTAEKIAELKRVEPPEPKPEPSTPPSQEKPKLWTPGDP